MFSLKKVITNSSSHGKTELKRIGYLDGWRGLAIAFVLISHFIPIPGVDLGRLGVDIFFVLSGLLMSKILFIKKVSLTIFYKRRISRIFPVFIVFLSTISMASYVLDLSSEHENYIYSLFFLRNYFPSTPSIWNTGIPIGNLWSLNVEEHCYIILSVITLFKVFSGKEYIPLLCLGAGAIILHIIYIKYPDFASMNYQLKTEIAASHLFISSGYFLIKNNVERFVFSWLPILTFLIAIFCYSSYAPWYASWLISPFLLAFTVNHLDRIPDFIKNFLSNRALQLLGIWSYSIYLWQQPIYFYGIRYEYASFSYAGIFLIFVVIFVGMLSFYCIENPIRTYLNNKW